MNPVKVIKSAYAAVKDPERPFEERTFLILTVMSELTVLVAFIGDLVTKENPRELAVLTATLILVPVIVLVCFHYDKLWFAIWLIMVALLFLILPSLFFFGGGLEGGGVTWIIFAFMYAGLLLPGKWRKFMFLVITVLTLGCYVPSYYFPKLVNNHSRGMFYVDSFISLVLVGVLCFIMTWSQRYLFTEDLERTRKEAEEAKELTRSQNRFFSSMSHEIRTPINSILGLNELILRDQSASDEIAKDATGIQGSGKLLLALINDILDFSKIEAGSMDIVPVTYYVGEMLSEIVNMLWHKAHEKGLEFEVSVDPDVPTALYGDEVRVKQVIINLLNNAIKYTKEGRVELRVDSKDVDEEAVELMISISDTGMGIRKEDLPYLFDAFKRVDEGKNRHIEGTGLGLSIVKQLVELMDGTVSVDSVYGEGSTFAFQIRQVVIDRNRIGELDIHNQQVVKRKAYESSFLAPEARILIVDDNEMNLEVESRLLTDTDMGIDTALNGRDALEKCLKVHYDAIFMDHLMPGMDGIECLEKIREQAGGLNRKTPVIVLTANAGSENRDLYARSGFDGYLVKPVSGESMEETLIQHIPGEKLILRNVLKGDDEVIHTSDRYAEKLPVIITATSMCDLPDAVVRKLHIPIIPFTIRTDEGVFKDGFQLDAQELIRHIGSGKFAESAPPEEEDYVEFFGNALLKAQHLIHIALTTSMSKDYEHSSEAAKSFDNVTIINSECISSATGILVLIAYKLVQQGLSVQEIVSELEEVKHRLRCSFVIDTTEYMERRGLVSHRLSKIAEALNLHPSLKIRDDKTGIGGIWLGRTRRAYRRYIKRALPPDTIPDEEVVFVTYADVPEDTLKWIEEEIRKTTYFEHVVFQQASASVSSNCGPGTFGILYFLKSNKSYNIASFLDVLAVDEKDDAEEDSMDEDVDDKGSSGESGSVPTYEDALSSTEPEVIEEAAEETVTAPWYRDIEVIDAEAAIKNSGSEDAFKTVLKIFYDSIPDKHAELDNNYTNEDWENYTIKIHALKSSAKLVGALELSEQAQRLETAGKENDIEYIQDHHAATMEYYLGFKDALAPVFQEVGSGNEADEKPVADDFLMESVYEGLREAAESMDCDMVDGIMKEIEGYSIPNSEKERFDLIRRSVDMFDYDGILEALDGK